MLRMLESVEQEREVTGNAILHEDPGRRMKRLEILSVWAVIAKYYG